MMAYDWPGNVRELEHFIERSIIMPPGRGGLTFDLPRRHSEGSGAELLERAAEARWTLERLEREYILMTLEESRWKQGATAELLGVNRRTIHRKLKRYREEGFLSDLPDE